MSSTYTPRRLEPLRGRCTDPMGRVWIGLDLRPYRLVSVHPSKDIVTLVAMPKLNLKELEQHPPSFIRAKITGGSTNGL